MVDYESKLIIFYAKHDVASVRSDPDLIEKEFGKSVEDLSQDRDFPRAKDFVETQKRYIEDRRDTLETPSARTQVAECLKLLLRQAMFPEEERAMFEHKMFVQQRLLIEIYGKKWSDTQHAHFEYMLAGLMAWKSYFLSYTNDNARDIYERYKKVIIRYVEEKVRAARDKNKDNLLADAIVANLKIRNLQRCFYDKENIGVGQNLDQKIKPAVENIFAFIQLVQTATFTAAVDNWCFKEWKLFSEANQKKLADRAYFTDIFEDRFAAILTQNNKRPDLIPNDYERWCDLIFTETHYLELSTDPEKFVATMQTLTRRIVNLQNEIVATVPA